jgi:hypothetical protein
VQLVINDGVVISIYRDDQEVFVPEGAELVQWDGPRPEPTYREYNGEPLVDRLPADPRTPVQKLLTAKRRKLRLLAIWDAARRRAGVSVPFGTLKSGVADQSRFAALLVAVNEAIDQGMMTLTDNVDVWGASESKITVTTAAFKSAVPGYLFACQTQENELDFYQTAIRNATTIQEVRDITWE